MNTKKLKMIKNSLLFFIGLLVLVWPMPHTIAIRNIDIGLLFIFTLFNYWKYKNHSSFLEYQKINKILFLLLIIFLLWAIFVSLISPFRNYCLKELYGQFIPPIILIFISFFIINSDFEKIKNQIFITIFITLMIFPMYHALYSIHFFLTHHHFPFRSYGITVGLDEINFLMPYLLTFFAVEIIFRILKRKTILPFSNSLLGLLFLISIFSLYVQAKRNGIISILFLIISVIFFVKLIHKQITKKFILLSLAGLIIGSALLYFDIKEDKRWDTLKATFKLVFIQDNMAGLYGKLPKLPNGQRADTSNYKRLFMIREGIRLILDNPIGYGYGREIFGKALSKKYHVNIHTHSHSGVIDWGIGLGIIGLIIWSAICFLILYVSFKNFVKYQNYFALLTFFLTTSFYFRMFLDSINKDHMLQQFVFFTSLALFAMQKEINEKNNLSSS